MLNCKEPPSLHCHTDYSNSALGFPDTINHLKTLIQTAKDLNLPAIAITDHEILSASHKALAYGEKIGIKVILGNEIYLQEDEQYLKDKEEYIKGVTNYPHFILLALDEIGHEQLRELSSIAWRDNSYYAKGLLRRITKFSDMENIVKKNKGHLFASTACLGGQFPRLVLKLINLESESIYNKEEIDNCKKQIDKFLNWCIEIFTKDKFAIELQPNFCDTEQWKFNKKAIEIAKKYDIQYICTTDSHYIKKEQQKLHKAFLTSKEEDDREVDAFYSTTYLMNYNELNEYFKDNISKEDFKIMIENTIKVVDNVKEYSLSSAQIVPLIDLPEFKLQHKLKEYYEENENIKYYAYSENEQDRYLIYLIEKNIYNIYNEDKKYLPTIHIDENTGEEIIVRYNYTFEDLINRINIELGELKGISLILKQALSGYYITMAEIVRLLWEEVNSIVGASRGSGAGFVINYLLEITQVNPLWYGNLCPHWRHLSAGRSASLADIDIDYQPSKKKIALNVLKRVFGIYHVLQVCTFGTNASKNSIRVAGRGLGEEYIFLEEIDELCDLIKVERGSTYSIKDCLEGDELEDRKPIPAFIEKAKQYPELIEVALGIENLIVSRSEHACGIIISNDSYTKNNCCMLSPNGNLTTQFDLNDSEAMGGLKFDLLAIDAADKINKCLNFLIENNCIEKKATLKATYDEYLHPRKLDYDNFKIWENIPNMPSVFQFDSAIGAEALKATKPVTIIDLSTANSLMRLMGEIDNESNIQRFVRYKNNIKEWYSDMSKFGLNEEEQEIMKKYLSSSRGMSDTQERIMQIVLDEKVSNFDLKLADKTRKAIAKKLIYLLQEIHDIFYKKGNEIGTSQTFLNYVWERVIMPQAKYAFSSIHAIAYSTIAVQEAILYTKYNSIYWNTSCLIIDSKTDEDNEDNKAQDYGKIAKSISYLKSYNVKMLLPDINVAEFGFKPYAENNSIVFGLKGIVNINDDISNFIIKTRKEKKFSCFMDFINRVDFNRKASIVSLIKAGCFDNINNNRIELMKEYFKFLIKKDYKIKNSITGKDLDGLLSYNIISKDDTIYLYYYQFDKLINKPEYTYEKIKSRVWLIAKKIALNFFEENYMSEMVEDKDYYYVNEGIVFSKASYNKIYKKRMDNFLKILNNEKWIQNYNEIIINEQIKELEKKFCGDYNIKQWEFESLCFYYTGHELDGVNKGQYNISNFSELPETPIIEEVKTTKTGKQYNKYKLHKICGTVLSTDKKKHTVTLLTTDAIVDVKFYVDNFIKYNKKITQVNEKNKKETIDESWFKRGNKLIVTGIRQDDIFRCKTYYDSVYKNDLILIERVDNSGALKLKYNRSFK